MYFLTDVPDATVTVAAQLAGFATQSRSFTYDRRARQVDFALRVGSVEETVTVSGDTPAASSSKTAESERPAPPSQNVIDLQRKAAGVLPVRVDVPRAGVSHQFVKPLVVDEAAAVRLRYKRR